MPVAAIWLLGLFAAISSIQLTIAWAESPPADRFANDINRVLIGCLGWAALSMTLIFAVTLSGLIWPPLAALAIGGGWTMARRRIGLTQVYWLSAPLAALALAVVLLLFQIVLGDRIFGLPDIFGGDDRL